MCAITEIRKMIGECNSSAQDFALAAKSVGIGKGPEESGLFAGGETGIDQIQVTMKPKAEWESFCGQNIN